jgi:catechol 2,3-dioxygenase-like lactoylglutathione lyase family enzyme
VPKKPKKEWTPLHEAAKNGDVSAARELLASGADPNAREPGDNTTPLHWAAARRNADIVQMLLDAGSDPQGAGDLHELDAIGWATYYTEDEHTGPDDGGDVLSLLVARGAKHHIYSALSLGDPRLVRQVVRDDPKAIERRMSKFEERRSALHFAIWRKRYDLLDLLIELGANVEAKDGQGRTPMIAAMLTNDRDAMTRLHRAGAKLPKYKKVAEIAPSVAKLAKTTSHTVTMLGVKDVPASLAWYASIGFTEVARYGTDFGVVRFGAAELFLKATRPELAAHREVGVWFYIKKVDELYQLLRSRQLGSAHALLLGEVAGPGIDFNEDLYDPFYGGRQFSILDPDGYTLFFYRA